jgi:hypothetical protein
VAVRNGATRDEIAVAATLAGLDLRQEHIEELVEAYSYVEPMLRRIHRGLAYASEPAHVFVAAAFQSSRRGSR